MCGDSVVVEKWPHKQQQMQNGWAAPNPVHSVEHRHRGRPILKVNSRSPGQFVRIKPELVNEFLVDEDDVFELSKRQQASDDYGHLRFGKRGEEPFDDYGHMRFGRSE